MKRYEMDAVAEFGQDAWPQAYEDSDGTWVKYKDVVEQISKLENKLQQYEEKDGMEGAVVGFIRELLNRHNVPKAAFIDAHVANVIVQRNNAEAEVARLRARADALLAEALDWRAQVGELSDALKAAEAKLATARDDALEETAQVVSDMWPREINLWPEEWSDRADDITAAIRALSAQKGGDNG
jgi:DNA repair exonuclease SbcCD ATPase subunit